VCRTASVPTNLKGAPFRGTNVSGFARARERHWGQQLWVSAVGAAQSWSVFAPEVSDFTA